MTNFNHQRGTRKVMVEHYRTQKVFGEWRDVHSVKHQTWRLRDGEVQVRNFGQWCPVEESDPGRTNEIVKAAASYAKEACRTPWGIAGCVRCV